MLAEFFKGFWGYVSQLSWIEGLITIVVVILTSIIGKYWKNVFEWIGAKFILNSTKTDTIQYRMYWGLIRDVIFIQVKDNLRRSMIENGFEEFSGSDYTNYVKDKSKLMMSMIKQHIVNLYPSPNFKLKVTMDQIIEFLDDWQHEFEDIVFEIFGESKKIKKQNMEIIRKLDSDFITEVENYAKINSNNLNRSCTECLMNLFGKREVVESRKRRVQTLKNQMNIVEQKLIEIQSRLLTFYSNELNKKEIKNGKRY
jgi:hypothetical protein